MGLPTTWKKLASWRAEISERQADWWAGPSLIGELAELAGSPDQAIDYYLRAVELGNVQPRFARRLVGLLNERNRFKEIDRVAQVLREQGVALDEITMIKAIDAIRKQDFDRGPRAGSPGLPRDFDQSGRPPDARPVFMSAGQTEAAEKEFRRAVELGPGIPDAWLTYVNFLTQAKPIDQARSVIEAARKALPPNNAAIDVGPVLPGRRRSEASRGAD